MSTESRLTALERHDEDYEKRIAAIERVEEIRAQIANKRPNLKLISMTFDFIKWAVIFAGVNFGLTASNYITMP